MEIHPFKDLVSIEKALLHGDHVDKINKFQQDYRVMRGDDYVKTDASMEEARKFMGDLLQEVLRLEFITIPLYLNAAYSLVQRQNKIYKLMVRLAKEEMGHMTVIANLMIAMGLQPKFTGKFAPELPGPLPLVKNEEDDEDSIWADLKSLVKREEDPDGKKESIWANLKSLVKGEEDLDHDGKKESIWAELKSLVKGEVDIDHDGEKDSIWAVLKSLVKRKEDHDGKKESIWADLKSFKGTRYPVTSQDDANQHNKDVMDFFLRIEFPDYEEEEEKEEEPDSNPEDGVPDKPTPTTIGELYHWLINIFDDPEYPSIRALLDDADTRTAKQLPLHQVPIKGTNDMRFHPVRLYADEGARDYTFNKHAPEGSFDLIIDGVEKAQDYMRWVAGEGEGASLTDPWAPSGLASHYFRFASTLEGKQMIPTPDGGGEYAGHDLDWSLDKIVYFDENPDPDDPKYSSKTREIMKQFDDSYSKMLKDLETSYEKEGDEKQAYYRRSSRFWMKEMGMAAKRLARHLMEENKPIGERGGLAFRYNPKADPGPMTNA